MRHSEVKKIIAQKGVTVIEQVSTKGGLRYNVTGLGDTKAERERPRTLTVKKEEMDK